MANTDKRDLPKKSIDISEWYNSVIQRAELADYGPAKGTMIFRPYGYGIWELIQEGLNKKIKSAGVENAYFPLFIPESLLKKEKDHVEGFAPELAVVTIGGGEELKERLVVRPTSETIMYDAYSKWIQSWRDLPMLINQWNNVVRWEKRTYLFMRTTEFLWQEGHTAHATHEEATQMQHLGMKFYSDMYKDYFAIPGYVGYKSQSEKFAGAHESLTYESLMPGGKALQSCTSHDLGQNFSKVFDIAFQDKDGERKFVWQTSWGFSTRSIGGLIMTHGDDAGIVLPPMLSPVQVVVLPVKTESDLVDASKEISDSLAAADVRVKVDSRDDESLGFRINKWELKGVPLRITVGKKELEAGKLSIARRDTGEKFEIEINNLVPEVLELLKTIQNDMYAKQVAFLKENTRVVDTFEEFKQIMDTTKGFISAFWCEDAECEAKIKEETKATTRCLPLDTPEEQATCVHCGKPATKRWMFAQSY